MQAPHNAPMLKEFLAAAALTLAVSALGCRLMIAAGVLDGPTSERKRENLPTPASGGVAMGLGFALGLAVLLYPPVRVWSAEVPPGVAMDSLVAVGLCFFFLLIGAVDDVRPIDPRAKFALFAAGALAAPIL